MYEILLYLSNTISIAHCVCSKVSKGAKIRNRYNQVPYLTQDTNGDHKAHINRRAQRLNKRKTEKKHIKDLQKKYRLGTVSKIFYSRA